MLSVVPLTAAQTGQPFELDPGDSVIVVGNTFAERVAMSGYLEALIHAAHPEARITVRQAPWSADEVGFQPRELNVPHSEAYLEEHGADVIIGCFGMSESFAGPAGLENFENDLNALLDGWASKQYNGESPPRVILVSPIAHENLGDGHPDSATITTHNDSLRLYADAMDRVAAARQVRFVDLYAPSQSLFAGQAGLTTNGIHPSERGCWAFVREFGRSLGWVDAGAQGGTPMGEAGGNTAVALRALAWDKHYHFRQLYRPTNTEYVWGRRAEPFGVVNFPHEQAQLRRMIDARQRALWEMPKPTPDQLFAEPPEGKPIWEFVPTSSDFPEDEWTLPDIAAQGTETSVGSTEIAEPEAFLESFVLADGYVAECFASEREFPELANPLAFGFDARHRLWVLCSPTYPHPLPGESPHDKLIVLSDTDGDGRADTCETFAEGFGIATGFAIDTDGVYLAHAPDLLKLVDTDGDGRADRREVVHSGFAMPDSHHQISAVEWSPDGGFVMHEGTFSSANLETPFGTRRGRDAAIWHFEPRTGRLEIVSHCSFPNPWGHAFDDYGASLMDSTSGGSHHAMSHISTAFDYPRKPRQPAPVLNRGRPTAGNEIVYSRHLPDEVQGSHMTTQSIGFHGVRWDRLTPGGSSWNAEPMPQDLMHSPDTNFRPVGVKVGPDGALYVLDWSNPLIGHMQYSVRDPRRDHSHGRVWRIRHADRPLVEPPRIEDASIPELLALLSIPERNTRQHVRRRLQTGEPTTVLPALLDWLDSIDPAAPEHDRLLLEALWVKHGLGVPDTALAARIMERPTAEARAGAIRTVRRWLHTGAVPSADALPLLELAVNDPDMRVRLEGVVACGFIDGASGASVAQLAAEHEMDDALRLVLDETLVHLRKYGEPDSFYAHVSRLRGLEPAALLEEPWDELVAGVVLERADLDEPARRRALATVADTSPAGRIKAIADTVAWSARPGESAEALAPLLMEALRETGSPLDVDPRIASHDDAAVRSLATAWSAAAGGSLVEMLQAEPGAALSALTMLNRSLSGEEAAALAGVIEEGRVDPASGIAVLTAHAEDRDLVTQWLIARVMDVAERGFDDWGTDHVVAMAAWSAIQDLPPEEWSEGYDELRVDLDHASIARGREIYLDEAIGCARCHAEDGTGLPGFPPLAGSPWVLGDGERAAAIVVHGLQGEITMPDGTAYRSAMAPLGANLDDGQIRDTLNYVRSSWGNFARPVALGDVRSARATRGDGGRLLDAAALLAAFPFADDRLLASPAASPTPVAGLGPESASNGIPLGMLLVGSAVFVLLVMAILAAFLFRKPSKDP